MKYYCTVHCRKIGDGTGRRTARPVAVREKRKGEGGVKTRDQLREEKKKALLAAEKRQEDRRRIMNGMAPIVRGKFKA